MYREDKVWKGKNLSFNSLSWISAACMIISFPFCHFWCISSSRTKAYRWTKFHSEYLKLECCPMVEPYDPNINPGCLISKAPIKMGKFYSYFLLNITFKLSNHRYNKTHQMNARRVTWEIKQLIPKGPASKMRWKSTKQGAKRATYRAPEYNVPPFWRISQGGHFCLVIGQKHTNLVEDVEILLLVKFRWIPFRGGRKCLSQSEVSVAILFQLLARKTQTW